MYVQTLVSLTQANDTLIDFTAVNPVSSPLAALALARLHELTTTLLPPLHFFQPDSEKVCGLDRCATLRSLLPALASGRQTHRIAERVLKRVKEYEQRKADRQTQQLAEAEAESKDADVNGVEQLPSLFPPSVSVRSTASETNGFHLLSPKSPSSAWSTSTSSVPIGLSPSTPSNGLHSGLSGTIGSKHHQLEQRLMGGGAQPAHVGLNGTHNDGSGNGSPHIVMVD